MNVSEPYKRDVRPSQLPLLELDLLRTLVAIADTGNFSAAADVVFRTPSAVSMQVKRIEELVGCRVFNRDSRSVSLTSEGEELLKHGRRLLALNREIVSRFVEYDVSGEVRLGATDYAAEYVLPSLLRRFQDAYPGVTVDVVLDNSPDLAEMIRRRQLDLAIVTCHPNWQDGLEVECLHQEQIVWAGLRGGIAANTNPLPISVWEEGCVWRQAAIEQLERIGRDFRILMRSAHIAAQKAAIMADLVIAPMPISSLADSIVEVGKKANLPPLGSFDIGLLRVQEPAAHIQAAADHIRANFSSCAQVSVNAA